MTTDHDLSALLPDPPPPRPAAREAALAAALRRFDGQGIAPASQPEAPAKPARPGWARPQVALVVSAVLVVVISTPIWWAERDRIIPGPAPTSAPGPAPAEGGPAPLPPPSSAVATPVPAVPPAATETTAAAESATPAERARSLESAVPGSNLSKLPQSVPAQTQAPSVEATFASEPARSQRSAVQPSASPATRASALPPPPPPPPPAPPPPPPAPARAARQAAADAGGVDQVTVSGSRIERDGYAARAPIAPVADAAPLDGEWNACTLDDPRRNPTACRSSARLSEGLALAWQGDLDAAIRAFGRALAAEPGDALAYLNRGLAYQRKGDLDRALADLDRAVARDRTGARGYYHRARLHRARGDEAQAEADIRRAIELDPAYAAAPR